MDSSEEMLMTMPGATFNLLHNQFSEEIFIVVEQAFPVTPASRILSAGLYVIIL